jgi:hypothetical protein
VSSDAIRAFVEAADQQVDTMHSFMLVRHGYVIAEAWWKPEAAEKTHALYSLSKSFTSTAVGLAPPGFFRVAGSTARYWPNPWCRAVPWVRAETVAPAFQNGLRNLGVV